MNRVKSSDLWILLCSNSSPGLSDVHGDKFEQLYEKYEKYKTNGKGHITIDNERGCNRLCHHQSIAFIG